MPTLAYRVVDVFTDRPLAGNPLAVVLDADDLPTEAMQAIAREFNLSETTFPGPSEVADYRLRIFTPGQEVPFAGHPSVGSAWLLAQLRRIPTGAVTQECGAGVLPVEVTESGATLTGGEPTVSEPLDPAPLLAAVRLDGGDLAGPGPRTAGTGLEWTYLPVRPEAVVRAVPDYGALRDIGTIGVCVVSFDPERRAAHSRCFAADVGEDPATGSAALGLGVYLAASGQVPADGETAYTISQGAEILRPSTLYGTVQVRGGGAVRATVAGGVTLVATGEITRP
jgi:trans-2,3-dihydro-3-hydroxyanthranilate isomerase